MDNYESWFNKGEQYFRTVKGKNSNPCKFTPTIQYNLLALAFESYAMSILDYFKKLPDNHTFLDLLDALEQVFPIETTLRNNILKHEEVQLICPVFEYHRREPSTVEVEDFKNSIKKFAEITKELIYKSYQKGF